MIAALLTLAGLGLIASLILGIASRVFAVEVDPRVEMIEDLLPSANCGGCGMAGCSAYAEALVSGRADFGGCPVNSPLNDKKIAKVLGVKAVSKEKRVAVLKCQGDYTLSVRGHQYFGVLTCQAAHLLAGGGKECPFGCLGYGDCQKACNFDSITIIDGLNKVEQEICTGCGACARVCPRHLIDIVPISKKVHVLCKSTDKGGAVTKYCARGCIGCKKCEKVCPVDAVHVTNFLSDIDYDKCVNCGRCAIECPSNCIFDEVEQRYKYEITEDCPGCMLCAKKCPVDAISGEKKQLHTIDQEKCIHCGVCFDVCKKDTIRKLDVVNVAEHMLKEKEAAKAAKEKKKSEVAGI